MYAIIKTVRRGVIDMTKQFTDIMKIDTYTKELSAVDNMKMEIAETGFADAYTHTLSENTKRAYMSTIKEFFGVNDLVDITVRDIQAVTPEIANLWAKRQFEAGMAPSTINRKLSALHNFYKFLCRRSIGVAEYNPFSSEEGCYRFKNAQKNYSDKRTLEPHEVNKMFNATQETSGIVGLRDLIVLKLLATTGIRRAELCSIKLGDIQRTGGKYVVNIIGKGDKHRLIVIAGSIYELIKEYVHERGLTMNDKDYPLITAHSSNSDPAKHINEQTVYRIVKKYAELAGVDPDTISPHNLRHTFATTAYLEFGLKPEEIQQLLGHSSINTTMIYTHTADMVEKSPAEKLESLYE